MSVVCGSPWAGTYHDHGLAPTPLRFQVGRERPDIQLSLLHGTGQAFGGKGTDDGCLAHGPSFRSSHHLHCGLDDNSGTASAGDRSERPPRSCMFLSFFQLECLRGEVSIKPIASSSLSLSLSPMTADRPLLAGVV